ncbi:hypothetical protein R3P38DRAFT_56026 [Favolaschia claudopus]|uniref:Uncharacterized protein n=1 Tax=Favolaschia claudopus TaxID=2862362 RepID=A0AAW0EIZ4_9AGAR
MSSSRRFTLPDDETVPPPHTEHVYPYSFQPLQVTCNYQPVDSTPDACTGRDHPFNINAPTTTPRRRNLSPSPSPKPKQNKIYLFGFRPFDDRFDSTDIAHRTVLGKLYAQMAGDVSSHTNITTNAKAGFAMVWFAVSDPELVIVTTIHGSTRIPYARHLEKLQDILGLEEGPMWVPDDGMVFREDRNVSVVVSSRCSVFLRC